LPREGAGFSPPRGGKGGGGQVSGRGRTGGELARETWGAEEKRGGGAMPVRRGKSFCFGVTFRAEKKGPFQTGAPLGGPSHRGHAKRLEFVCCFEANLFRAIIVGKSGTLPFLFALGGAPVFSPRTAIFGNCFQRKPAGHPPPSRCEKKKRVLQGKGGKTGKV